MKNKKEEKKRLSTIEESSLGKLTKELGSTKSSVKDNAVRNQHNSPGLMECEKDIVRCTFCFWEKEGWEGCKWFRDNKCTSKCKSFENSIDSLGFIDINKVKHHKISNEEKVFKRKVRKYINFAETIDSIYEEELKKINDRKKEELVKQKIQEMRENEKEEVQEEPDDTKQRRKNIKSLI